jgi:hypothetical protein
MSDLRKLLEHSDPRRRAELVEEKIVQAVRNMHIEQMRFESYPMGVAFLSKVYQAARRAHDGANVDDMIASGYIHRLIGARVGHDEAREMLQYNTDGGLAKLIDLVCQSVLKEATDNYDQGAIAMGVDLSDYKDRQALAREYLDQVGPGLSEEEKSSMTNELAWKLEHNMEKHLEMLHEINRIIK